MTVHVRDYCEEKIGKLNDAIFLDEDVLEKGSLVITADNRPVTILTRPFNRPHFGLSTWLCCGYTQGGIYLVYVNHLSYMRTKDFKVLVQGLGKSYQKPQHVIK